MNENFNILRLCCLIQDRDAQDLKRIALSIIQEILYENENSEINSDLLFNLTNDKFNTALERDFFDNLLTKSKSFILITTEGAPFVKLTELKYLEIDKNITEYSIDSHIQSFLEIKGYNIEKKEIIIELLFQSIYENIHTFTPDKIKTIIPQKFPINLTQADLDVFNEFLEYDEPTKNRCLYNQFAKAIEFAILTSGKGITKITQNLFKDKSYLLDTNIIFRLIGVGGTERQSSIKELIQSCISQGIKFEYSHHTLLELNKKLEQCVIDIKRAETSKKISIVTEIYQQNDHYFNDDFITQYCKLRIDRQINSPEQYELRMKTNWRQLCKELGIIEANHGISIKDGTRNVFANHLIEKRKEINEYFRYSNNQARVDAYNVLYVRAKRSTNNYNYADVKSFYLTTDRGLNKILSEDKQVNIPETILPSQLFLIHNPLSGNSDKEPDYKTFFRFLKRRTSDFKLRGKAVLDYINQARAFTTNPETIVSLIEAYSDQRYKYSKVEALEEENHPSFRDFSKTYFDQQKIELKEISENYLFIVNNAEKDLNKLISISNWWAKAIDIFVTFIIIPFFIMLLKNHFALQIYVVIIFLVIFEVLKFLFSTRTKLLKNIWLNIFTYKVKRSSYFRISKDDQYISKGIELINKRNDNIWK